MAKGQFEVTSSVAGISVATAALLAGWEITVFTGQLLLLQFVATAPLVGQLIGLTLAAIALVQHATPTIAMTATPSVVWRTRLYESIENGNVCYNGDIPSGGMIFLNNHV